MSQNPSPPPGAPPPGAGARKPDAKPPPLGKRSYTLKVSFSMLLTTLIVSIIGICWIFMLGVMVGRGYNPDAKVHEAISRISRGNQAAPPQEQPVPVLKSEALGFWNGLKDKPPLSIQRNATANPVAPAPSAESRPAAAAGTDETASLPSLQPSSPPPSAATRSTVYDYVYQIATFKEPEQADKLREILEGEGLRTRLEKIPAKDGKSTLYKVLTLLRGSEDYKEQMLASLERLRLGPPFLRSKAQAKSGTERR